MTEVVSIVSKKPMNQESFSEEDLQALAGLNDLRDLMIEHGVRAYYVTFLDRESNIGYLWRNTDDTRLRALAEGMIERGLLIDQFLKKKDPHNPESLEPLSVEQVIEQLSKEIPNGSPVA